MTGKHSKITGHILVSCLKEILNLPLRAVAVLKKEKSATDNILMRRFV